MAKKLWVIALLLSSSQLFANICPSVAEIHNKQLDGWQILDNDDQHHISKNRYEQFKQFVKEFAMAEWKQDSSIRCYYRDTNGSNLDTFLAKNNFVPDNTKNYWYDVSNCRECAAGIEKCQFKTIAQQKKLAEN